jgi:hypothetical protein
MTSMRSLYLCFGTRGRIRTYDLRLRKPTLYPAELHAHNRGDYIINTLDNPEY